MDEATTAYLVEVKSHFDTLDDGDEVALLVNVPSFSRASASQPCKVFGANSHTCAPSESQRTRTHSLQHPLICCQG